MNENTINIFLLSMGLLQGLLIVALIFSKDKNALRSANFYLALFILAISYQTISKIVSKSWYAHNFRFMYTLAYDLPFLYGPLIYLYVSKSLKNERSHIRDVLHAIPFCMGLLAIVFYGFTTIPVLSQMTNFFHNCFVHPYTRIGSLAIYYVLIAREFERITGQADATLAKEKFDWLFRFANVSMAVCFFLTCCIIVMFGYFPRFESLRFLFLVLPLLMYWISYQALVFPHIFQNAPAPALSPVPAEQAPEPNGGELVKYRKTPLREEDAGQTLHKLMEYLEREEPYLDPEFSLDKVAAYLNLSRNHLSQVINQKLALNFFELINERRLSKAKSLLQSPGKKHLTIAAIAYESGFNSISSFNEVFKKNTALTPKAYRRQYQVARTTSGL